MKKSETICKLLSIKPKVTYICSLEKLWNGANRPTSKFTTSRNMVKKYQKDGYVIKEEKELKKYPCFERNKENQIKLYFLECNKGHKTSLVYFNRDSTNREKELLDGIIHSLKDARDSQGGLCYIDMNYMQQQAQQTEWEY